MKAISKKSMKKPRKKTARFADRSWRPSAAPSDARRCRSSASCSWSGVRCRSPSRTRALCRRNRLRAVRRPDLRPTANLRDEPSPSANPRAARPKLPAAPGRAVRAARLARVALPVRAPLPALVARARVGLRPLAVQAGQEARSVPRGAQVSRAAALPIQRVVVRLGRAARDLAMEVDFAPLAAVRRAVAGSGRVVATLATGVRSDRRAIDRPVVDRRVTVAPAQRDPAPEQDLVDLRVPVRRQASAGLASPGRGSRLVRLAPALGQSVQDRLDPVLAVPGRRAPLRPKLRAGGLRRASVSQAG